MKRWENRVEQIPGNVALSEVVAKLDEFGEDGWEAYDIVQGAIKGAANEAVPILYVHLKREKLKQ